MRDIVCGGNRGSGLDTGLDSIRMVTVDLDMYPNVPVNGFSLAYKVGAKRDPDSHKCKGKG